MVLPRILLVLAALIFCFEFPLLHQAQAQGSEPRDDDVSEFAAYAPGAADLAAAERNFQRWMSHVRRTSLLDHDHHRDANRFRGPDHAASNNSGANAEHQPMITLPAAVKKKKQKLVCRKRVIYVEKDGSGNFTSIQAAINSIPRRNKCRVDIIIGSGVFREKVAIRRSKPHITLKGNPLRHTIIVWNDTASSRDKKGRRLRTMHSATVVINSNYFIAKNITFMNTAPAQKPGAVAQQAVALRISGDKAAFFNCRFYGNQDTLYDHRGRHYFKNCYITGTVDFIFGNGRSLYDGADLVALAVRHGIPGTITAQRRNKITADTGFSFVNCRITGAGMVYLGRAWGNDSRVVFANTFMDKVVVPAGWGNWGVPAREKTVFYAQFNCSGPGADTSHRVRWSRNLTASEAAPFLTPDFINGKKWLEGYKHKSRGKKPR